MVLVDDPKTLGLIVAVMTIVAYVVPLLPVGWARKNPMWFMRFSQWAVLALVTYHILFVQHEQSAGTSSTAAWVVATAMTMPFTILGCVARQAGRTVGAAVLFSTMTGSALYTAGQAELSGVVGQAAVFLASVLAFSIVAYLAYRKGTPSDGQTPSNMQVGVRLVAWTVESLLLGLLLVTTIRQSYKGRLNRPERMLSLRGDTNAWIMFCLAALVRVLFMLLGVAQTTATTKYGRLVNALAIDPFKGTN